MKSQSYRTRISSFSFQLPGDDDNDDENDDGNSDDDDDDHEGKKLRDMFYLLSSLLAALTRRGTLLRMKINITITTTNSQ